MLPVFFCYCVKNCVIDTAKDVLEGAVSPRHGVQACVLS